MDDDLFNLFGKNNKWTTSRNDPLSIEKLMASDEINRGFDWGGLVSRRVTQPRRQMRMPAKKIQQPMPRKDPQKYQVAFDQNGVDRKVGFKTRTEAMRYYNKIRASGNYDDVVIRGQ